MKMKKLFAAALAAVLLLTACSGRFHTDAPMESFVFSHSGMHTGSIYTLSAQRTEQGWQAELSLFCGEKLYTLPLSQAEADSLAALLDAHDLWSWNGFDKVDRRVQDGTAFDLTIRFADGKKLFASGSNAFPKGYHEAKASIKAFFVQVMENNGISNPF